MGVAAMLLLQVECCRGCLSRRWLAPMGWTGAEVSTVVVQSGGIPLGMEIAVLMQIKAVHH